MSRMTRIQPKSIGFVGGGRVARIVLAGLARAGAELPRVVVSEPDERARGTLRAALPEVELALGDSARAAAQELVFLAVPASAVPGVLPALGPALRPSSVLISLTPTFTLAKLSELAGGFSRIARMVPNAPSLIGAGYNPIAFGPGLSPLERRSIAGFFAPLGACPEVDEAKLEGYVLLTGMGPTYLWFQLQALRELSRTFGLTESDVDAALPSMVFGATRLLLEGDLSPAEVMDLVPVKPLAADEAGITQAYRSRLPAVYEKLKL